MIDHVDTIYKPALILAFPGSGKTTAVKWLNKNYYPAIDLDIKGNPSWKGESCPYEIRNIMSDYVDACLRNGASVFTFAHCFTPRHFNFPIYSYLPQEDIKYYWVGRIRERDGKNSSFAESMFDNWSQWRMNWMKFEDKLRTYDNIVHVGRLGVEEYLSNSINTILLDPPKSE